MQRIKEIAEWAPALARAIAIVYVIRIGLRLLPFGFLRRQITKIPRRARRYTVDQIVWTVLAVSRSLPGSSCLTLALACQALLADSGHRSRIEIGVAKKEQRFAAHAWLVCEDRIVLGGSDVNGYASLTAWDGNR
jgi:hypothetical protein